MVHDRSKGLAELEPLELQLSSLIKATALLP